MDLHQLDIKHRLIKKILQDFAALKHAEFQDAFHKGKNILVSIKLN